MFLFDILFVLSFLGCSYILGLLLPPDPSFLFASIKSSFVLLFFILVFLCIALALLILVFSFFAYFLRDLLQNIVQKTVFSFSSFFSFYKTSLATWGILLFIFVLLNIFFVLIRTETIAYVYSLVTFFPFLVFALSFLFISHLSFTGHRTFRAEITHALFLTFQKPRYLITYGVVMILLLAYIPLYYLLAMLFALPPLQQLSALLVNILAVITAVYSYLVFTYSRALFFLILREEQ